MVPLKAFSIENDRIYQLLHGCVPCSVLRPHAWMQGLTGVLSEVGRLAVSSRLAF